MGSVALVASRDILMEFMMAVATLAQPGARSIALLGRKIATPILLDCHRLLANGSDSSALVLESYTVDVYGFSTEQDGGRERIPMRLGIVVFV